MGNKLELPDKITGHRVKFEFPINIENILIKMCPKYCMGHTFIFFKKKSLLIWNSNLTCILSAKSGNPKTESLLILVNLQEWINVFSRLKNRWLLLNANIKFTEVKETKKFSTNLATNSYANFLGKSFSFFMHYKWPVI